MAEQKNTSQNVLTDLDKERYCAFKTTHKCTISKPAYVKNADGTNKTDANGRKIPLYKTETVKGKEKRVPVNEFSETVSFRINWSGVTFGNLLDKFVIPSADIKVQRVRDAGLDAVKAIHGAVIDGADLITERRGGGLITAQKAVSKIDDADALRSLEKAIQEKLKALNGVK